MDSLDDIAAMTADGRVYDPDEVVLIGTSLDPKATQGSAGSAEGQIKVVADLIEALTLSCKAKTKGTEVTIAVVYAYSFEGHTYRLPKPRIMVLEGAGEVYKPTKLDKSAKDGGGKLLMWRMSKHQHSVSIEVESGALETLVLNGNTPGNRSATSYHSHMQLSHRGGKLS